jgi:hypothetical protein
MGQLPTDLRLLDATVCACSDESVPRALISAEQMLMLPPWVSCDVLKPREPVRVLIRIAPDGGVDPLAVQRAEASTPIPLGPRIASEIVVLGAVILVAAIVFRVYWLLAVPGSLLFVQAALSERRRRAVRWFRSAEEMPPDVLSFNSGRRAAASTVEVAWACPCSQQREAGKRARRIAEAAVYSPTRARGDSRACSSRTNKLIGESSNSTPHWRQY